MRAKIYLFLFLNIFLSAVVFSQNNKTPVDTGFFNYAYWNGVADKEHLRPDERAEMIEGQKKIYLEELSNEHAHEHYDEKKLIWVSEQTPTQRYSQNTINAGPCTNIDFESGTFAGWTRSTGFNPLTNATGCCPNPNGDQTIVTGAGVDPFGGFPIVYPGAGNFSLRLGSTAIGGIADRVQQTFFVTPSNANFTYRFAVVLNDPGHVAAQQPRFTSEIIDTLGNQIICTVYSVTAGGSIPGFSTSAATGPGNSAVRYRNWTDVALDLTPNIGQNVTIRFTVFDCSPTGHFAYAYIDGLCTNFATAVSDTTCPNIPVAMCAPAGFSTTTWNGPGYLNDPNQCITPSIPGTYTCTTLLVPGCPGPTFIHTLVTLPDPFVFFTPVSSGPCSTQYTFSSGANILTPYNIVSYLWKFGDGSVSTLSANPVHNYSAPGTYSVTFKAVSDRGCADSVVNFITIFPTPTISFSPPSNCINTAIQFTNTSTISPGTISSYTWNFFGNGPNSNLTNPIRTYTANGTYSITLSATSNQGCTSSLTQTLGIFPPPVISFSAGNLCDANGTSFAPSTSTAIASGSLSTFFWNFGDGGTSNLPNPVHVYTTTGVYTVSFTAISNHNCSASISNTFAIFPSPNVAFATTSVNACSPNFTFTNNSNIASGSVTYTWHYGGTNSTTAANPPPYTFPSIGNYTVKLIGVSNLGCTDTAYNYITIYPLPVINFSVPSPCESASIQALATAVSGSVTSYNWNFDDPGSGAANTSTLQNPTHFFSSVGIYNPTLNIVSNLNCPSSSVLSLTVFPDPVALFSYSSLNNCSLPYLFSNSSSVSTVGASNIAAHQWNFGGINSSTLANPSYTFPGNGNYTVSLIVTTNHNCSNSATANILVHPLPVLNFTVNPTCLNVPVSINSSTAISTTPSTLASVGSYTWNYGDGNFANTPISPPHSYTNSGVYTILFGATSNMGCSAITTRTVLIHPIASSDFSTTSALCINGPIAFTSTNNAIAPGAGTIFATTWDLGDGTTASTPSVSHTYSVNGIYLVSFSVTTNNECVTSNTKTVTINARPVVTFTTNGGCLNVLSQFSQTATIAQTNSLAPSSITSFSWNFGDGSSPTYSIAQNPNHTYLAASVPLPYTASLTVISNNSCVTVATNTVQIDPLPDLFFSPPGACVNSLIQFTNTSNILAGTINSYTWNFGGGNTSNAVNPTYSYSLFGPYTVTLGATSNLGCTKTVVNNLTIHPYPELTVTPVYNSCVNDSAQINTNITIDAGTVQSYTLGFGDGGSLTSTVLPAPYLVKHKYTAYSTYSVTLKAISAAGCLLSRDTFMIVYPKPFVNFTSANFCNGDLTVFTNSSSIPPPYTIDEHLWNFNDASATPTSTLSSPSHLFFAPNTLTTYPVSLTEISRPEGTTSPVTCSLTTVKTVTIFPTPVAAFSTNTVCQGISTSFTNLTPTVNVAGWSWYFYNNGQLSSLAPNPSFTYSSTATHTAQLIALNSFGCRDTAYNTITIYQNPVPSFTTDNNCFGQQSIFNNTNNIYPSYLWTTGTTTIGPGPDNAYPFPTPGTFSVTLTATSSEGCTGKFTNTVTVHPLPQLSFNGSDACIGNPTQFANLSSGAITSFTWNFGDVASGSANISNVPVPAHLYSNAGSYSVTLRATSDKNCQAIPLTTTVMVHNVPLANFTHTTICAGDKLTFANLSVSNDGAITSGQWDFNGDNIVDQSTLTPLYTYSLSGNYQIRLTVTTQYGCSDDTVKQAVVHPKAVGEISSNNKTGCPPLCIDFKNISTISTGSFSTTWDFGNGNPVATSSNASQCFDSGTYDISLTLLSDMGCVTKFVHPGYVSVYPVPIAGFKVEPEEIDENEPVINVSSQTSQDVNFLRYYINDGSSYGNNSFTHYIKNLKETKPMVVQVVKNQFGCADTISQVLNIKPAYAIYFPNVFTPNGDGTNDDFMPKGVGILKFTMQIFDRWGKQVYRTNDITDTWDGQIKNSDAGFAKEDVYTWKAQVTDIFNKNHFLVGHVTVIR